VTVSDAMPALLDSSTVMVRNMMPGVTIIAGDAKRNYEISFQAKDDPEGEDVQAIPDALIATVQFQNAIRKGVFEVVAGADHPVVQQAMSRQTDAFRKRMASDSLAAREVLDAVADNDLLMITCIGPGTRSGAVCGENLAVKEKEQLNRPPLCDRHQHLGDYALKRGSQPWVLELPDQEDLR
jgi:hypothetical protein